MQIRIGSIINKREFKWGGFIILDAFQEGVFQCVINDYDLSTIALGSFIKVQGEFVEVKSRLTNEVLTINASEFKVSLLKILSTPAEIDVNIFEKEVHVDIDKGFDIRQYVLRNHKNKCIFKIQSSILQAFRNFMDAMDYVSISTPKIVASGAEGGSNVFELDYFGKKAYLAQSPQFYKQMMCGVFGGVYETAPVFRAESFNTSRHINEYLSLDVETILRTPSFLELCRLEKNLFQNIFSHLEAKNRHEMEYLGIDIDKLRRDMENAKILTVHEVKHLLNPILNLDPDKGATADDDLSAEEEKAICKYAEETFNTNFVFVTHYGRNRRPFYTKVSPDGISTESFYLLYKGMEITSGGQRKNNYEEYVRALHDAGIMDSHPFQGYLDTFRKYGMPAHGGFAIGLERVTAKICGLESVKAATLFPRDTERLNP